MHKLTLRSTDPKAAGAIIDAIVTDEILKTKYALDGGALVVRDSRDALVSIQDATEARFKERGATNYAFEITTEKRAAETPQEIGRRLKTHTAMTTELKIFKYLTAMHPSLTMRDAAAAISAWQE